MVMIAGAVRKKNGVWSVIDDAGHTPVNLASVVDKGTHLAVGFGFTAEEVISLTVTPDEAYAMQGFTFGASVGFYEARVYIHQEGQPIGSHVRPEDMPEGNSNIWVLGYVRGVSV